jgi:hypothetical protein
MVPGMGRVEIIGRRSVLPQASATGHGTIPFHRHGLSTFFGTG